MQKNTHEACVSHINLDKWIYITDMRAPFSESYHHWVSSPRAISKFADKVLRYNVESMKVASVKGYNF